MPAKVDSERGQETAVSCFEKNECSWHEYGVVLRSSRRRLMTTVSNSQYLRDQNSADPPDERLADTSSTPYKGYLSIKLLV
ncbi:3775_t:CDS:1, partial [Paraglomus occultum]